MPEPLAMLVRAPAASLANTNAPPSTATGSSQESGEAGAFENLLQAGLARRREDAARTQEEMAAGQSSAANASRDGASVTVDGIGNTHSNLPGGSAAKAQFDPAGSAAHPQPGAGTESASALLAAQFAYSAGPIAPARGAPDGAASMPEDSQADAGASTSPTVAGTELPSISPSPVTGPMNGLGDSASATHPDAPDGSSSWAATGRLQSFRAAASPVRAQELAAAGLNGGPGQGRRTESPVGPPLDPAMSLAGGSVGGENSSQATTRAITLLDSAGLNTALADRPAEPRAARDRRSAAGALSQAVEASAVSAATSNPGPWGGGLRASPEGRLSEPLSGALADAAAGTRGLDNQAIEATVRAHMATGLDTTPGGAPDRAGPASAAVTMTVHTEHSLGAPGWNQEFGAQVNLLVSRREPQAQIRINPPHLGPVEVRIGLQGDQVSLAFAAPQAETRAAIENALPHLREMLAESGLALGNASVNAQASEQQSQPRTAPGTRTTRIPGSDEPVTAESAPAITRLALGLVDTFA